MSAPGEAGTEPAAEPAAEQAVEPRAGPGRPAPTGGVASASRKAGVVLLAIALVTVVAAFVPQAQEVGQERVYYIAADEVEWNYTPSGTNVFAGRDFNAAECVFFCQASDRIGSTYLKAVYREYTDDSFTVLKPRDGEAALGILGPVIRAEVGDTIKVVFKNNARYNFSVHPHGVFYAKDSEGAPYDDGTGGTDKLDDAVAPGATYTYTWQVPERAGPGPADGNSILWAYHSHVDEAADTNAGLVGPIVIYAKGALQANGLPEGVDRELFALYTIFDENESPYLWDNIGRFVSDPGAVEYQMALAGGGDEGGGAWRESNLMHTINGYAFANGPGYTMGLGEHVRWYVLSIGSEADLHTPHWHGNTFLTPMGARMDMLELLPMSMKVVDMVPDNPGVWMFHCHVNDHFNAGMVTTYTVE